MEPDKCKGNIAEFSPEAWSSLEETEKTQHTLRGCEVCKHKYAPFTHTFPSACHSNQPYTPTITFSPEDMKTPENFGAQLLAESNKLTKATYQKSVQDVIHETPKSHLVRKPTNKQRKSEKRKVLRDVRNTMQDDMNKEADPLVLSNRISWTTYKIRTTPGLERRPESDGPVTKTKGKHGCLPTNLEINKESLLQEARTWEADQSINWSQLGTKYGLQTANRGQVIKEFLADQGIEAAQANQRPHRASRRSKKRLGANISFIHHKQRE